MVFGSNRKRSSQSTMTRKHFNKIFLSHDHPLRLHSPLELFSHLFLRATCVYVLPVASRRSSIIGANWCSVVIGTKSGSLLFYSEEGIALLRQQVFTQSVDAVSISVSATLLGYFYASSGQCSFRNFASARGRELPRFGRPKCS